MNCQHLETRQLEEPQTNKEASHQQRPSTFFLISFKERRLEKGKSRRDAQGNMGTGQGPGLRGSAPGGTGPNFIVWGGRGVVGKWARELGHGYLVSEWGEIGTGMASTTARTG